MHHDLKTHPAMYHAVRSGSKSFDVRKDDRAFQCGDTVTLKYHDPAKEQPGGFMPPMPYDEKREPLNFTIGFVLRGGQYGVEPGYVVFSLHGHIDETDPR